MRKLFLFVMVLFLATACSTSKSKTSKQFFLEVNYGNYGGFSNSSTEYILTGSGQLAKVENNIRKPIKKAKNKEIRNIRQQLDSIDFKNLNINELGNLTYFIKVKTSDYENTVKWNDETQNTDIKNTYKMLFEILK